MPDNKVAIFWFRQDLRLSDNPGLSAAALTGKVLAIYICDKDNSLMSTPGSASKWWIYQSLSSLNRSLHGKLNFYTGKPLTVIRNLIKKHNVGFVFWNRCYEPEHIQRDKDIKSQLQGEGLTVKSYNSALLWEPWEIPAKNNAGYKVFSGFYRHALLAHAPRKPHTKPKKLSVIKDNDALTLDALGLLPHIRWDKQLEPHWHSGEKGAQRALQKFLKTGIKGYKEGRNFPAREHVSRLSPYLHSGEISPHAVWHAAKALGNSDDVQAFCRELAWREFSYYQLYHFPALAHENWQKKFDRFPWSYDQKTLERWQKGMTGYPIVDAGMRQLWQTGYMHNRVRMIVASFLVKNLLFHWHHGAKWFWDCLVDADMANNSASWQWVAGSGIGAAPFFRIFNPIGQGEKFDEQGLYTRYYVPELAQLPDKYLFRPWQAPAAVLAKAGIILGKTYPEPMVDLAFSRQRALEIFSSLSTVKSG